MSDQTNTLEKPLEFVPFGAQDKIRLTIRMVQDTIAVRTKQGHTCSAKEAIKFMMLCHAKRLNPYEGDAYLIGYDGREGPTFSLITAHQAFLKRAELHPEFDGMKSGIIIEDEEGKLAELEGDFYRENQKVVGGWATVFFKTRKHPIHRKIRLERFRKPFGVWLDDAAGMICKCAEADALRSAFPTMLGGLYCKEEFDPNKTAGEMPVIVTTDAPIEESVTPSVDPPSASTAQNGSSELSELIVSNGFTFSDFQMWCVESGNWPEADSAASFEEVPEALSKRWMKARKSLLDGLKRLKEVSA